LCIEKCGVLAQSLEELAKHCQSGASSTKRIATIDFKSLSGIQHIISGGANHILILTEESNNSDTVEGRVAYVEQIVSQYNVVLLAKWMPRYELTNDATIIHFYFPLI
jgi:hypothetical protein